MCFSLLPGTGHRDRRFAGRGRGHRAGRGARWSWPSGSSCRIELPRDLVIAQQFSADSPARDDRLGRGAGRLDGPRHRPGHARGPSRGEIAAGGDRVLERADGRLRDGAVRRRHQGRRRGGARPPAHDRRRRRRLGRGARAVRPRRSDRPRLDRRRRLDGAARRQARCPEWRCSRMPSDAAGRRQLEDERRRSRRPRGSCPSCVRAIESGPTPERRGLALPALHRAGGDGRGGRRLGHQGRGPEHARGASRARSPARYRRRC